MNVAVHRRCERSHLFLEETHETRVIDWTQDKTPPTIVSLHKKRLLGQHILLANERNDVAFEGNIVKIAERRSINIEIGFHVLKGD